MDNDDFQKLVGQGGKDGGDAALEARLVAWVLGEASVFEAAEMERLVAAQPELALFKRRIEAVHGLLGEAARVRNTDTLRLAPERREKVLAAIGALPIADALGGTPAPTVVEPIGSQKRSFGSGWKALRLYFGVTAACMLVFLLLVPVGRVRETARRAASSAGVFQSIGSESDRELRLRAVEEAKSRIHARKDANLKSRAEYEEELVRRQVELVRAEVQLQAMAEGEAQAPVQVMEPTEWSRSYASGGITVPVTRNIGAGRIAPLHDRIAFGVSEPETVPAGGEDQRVEMDLFEVKASREGSAMAVSQTISGSRMNPVLKDVGSAITVVSADAFGDVSDGSGRAASSYKDGSDRPSGRGEVAGTDVDTAWKVGFDAAPSVSFGVGNADGIVASAERPTSSFFSMADPVLESRGGAATGSESIRGLRSSSVPPSRVLWAADQLPAREYGTPPPAPPMAGEFQQRDVDKKAERERKPVEPPAAIDEAHAAKEPVSTFSLHVSDASFKLAQAALARGQLPETSTIRPEEFYNAFDYGDPSPSLGQKVACRIEQAAHPFLQQRTLVRVAMKVANTGRGAGQPLRLTVLLDTSGSMEREDRIAAVRRAMEVLASLLGPNDRVSLIGFARQPRLLAEAVRGDEARRLVDMVARTPADGGTNMEEALKLTDELARRHFEPAAQNRIVLLTDGAANLGNAEPARLAAHIEGLRGRGIAFDACGVGTDGLDDEILEALTRQGDGRYYVLDSADDADAGFARQLAGAFRPAAKNVKVQVRFNPARVGAYRLLGFEKHRLREEDFRNDRVDAAELAAEEAAVAVYQVEVLPQGEGELGDVFVRFRDMASGEIVERSWTIAHDSRVRAFDQASPSLQLAGTSSLLAEVLRGGALGDQVDLGALAPVVNRLKSHYAQQPRVQELVTMFEQVRRITHR